MNAAARYAAALYPDTYYVLGRRMAHYTIGHALLLHRLNSPFVDGGREQAPGPADVKLFLLLCGRKYPRALRLVKTADRWPGLFLLRLSLIDMSARHYDLALAQIGRYLTAAADRPTRWEKEGEKALGSPELQQIKLTLMSRLHLTELQALCTPHAKALWDAWGLWEIDGRMDLADQEDLAAARETIEEAKREFNDRNGNTKPPETPARN